MKMWFNLFICKFETFKATMFHCAITKQFLVILLLRCKFAHDMKIEMNDVCSFLRYICANGMNLMLKLPLQSKKCLVKKLAWRAKKVSPNFWAIRNERIKLDGLEYDDIRILYHRRTSSMGCEFFDQHKITVKQNIQFRSELVGSQSIKIQGFGMSEKTTPAWIQNWWPCWKCH